MDNRLQATFMPRQSPVAGNSFSSRPKAPTNFLLVIGVLMLVLVLGGMGALFAYRAFLVSGNAKKQVQIEDAIKNFEPELTRELTILKARVDAGNVLLSRHNALSLLFTLLEVNTVRTVQFKELSYTVMPDKTVKLAMKGEAKTYNAVAFQSDTFSKVEQLRNPMFTSIALSENGTVKFNFTADLDPNALLYKRLVAAIPPGTTETIVSTPVASTTSATTTLQTNQPGS